MQDQNIQKKQSFITNALNSPIRAFIYFSSILTLFQILGVFLFPYIGFVQFSIYFTLSGLYTYFVFNAEYQRQTKNLTNKSKEYSIIKNKMLGKTSSIMIVFLTINMTFYIAKPETSMFLSLIAVIICSTLISIYFYLLNKSTIDLYKDELK